MAELFSSDSASIGRYRVDFEYSVHVQRPTCRHTAQCFVVCGNVAVFTIAMSMDYVTKHSVACGNAQGTHNDEA